MNRRNLFKSSAAVTTAAMLSTHNIAHATAQYGNGKVGATKNSALQGDILASGLLFPEGPIAMADGSVVLVELAGDRLTHIDRQGSKTTIAKLPGGPNGAAMGPDGNFYICLSGGLIWKTENGHTFSIGPAKDYKHGAIQRVNAKTGAAETLYTHCDGVPLRAPNDLVFDKAGGLWFSDLGKTVGDVMYRGNLYYAKTDGSSITRVTTNMPRPNGVGLSPDGSTLFVAEFETARLWSYKITKPGQLELLKGSPNGGKFVAGLPGLNHFDSLAIEQNGNICVATIVAGGITVFSPDGEVLEFHQSPEAFNSNICFGGAEMKTAYVTLSSYGNLFKAQWPRSGLKLNFQESAVLSCNRKR